MAAASYPRSPSTQSGRWRGRPRSPWSGGIASPNARASCESFRFAAGEANREWHTPPVANHWRLLPRLARSVGFGSVWPPPNTARMQQLCTTARDQSIWSSRASQSRSAKWIRSHTPASCQPRRAASMSSPTRTRVPAGASARLEHGTPGLEG